MKDLQDFFRLLGTQPADIRIMAGLISASVGLLLGALIYPLVGEMWKLITRRV